MLNTSKLTFELRQLIGDVSLILLNATPTYQYQDGVKTDTIIGTTYEVVEDGGNYDKFRVKVSDLGNSIDPDFIKNSKSPIKVDFENATCKLYNDAYHHLQVSVSASAITLL